MSWPKIPTAKIVTPQGQIHPQWNMYLTQLMQQLENNFSQNGTAVPQRETADITQIASVGKTAFVLDSQTGDLKFIKDGTIKTVTLT